MEKLISWVSVALAIVLAGHRHTAAVSTNAADVNDDGKVDLRDFAVISDISGDGAVDIVDVAIMAANWLWTSEMVSVPAGTFDMGDSLNEGAPAERPHHTVNLDAVYMSKCPITNRQYCDYLNAAFDACDVKVDGGIVYAFEDDDNEYPYCDMHSYDADSQLEFAGGSFSVVNKDGRNMVNDPMVEVSWYGAVAYCNWRSGQEDYQSCYDLSTWDCDFSKDGYRLPTEGEWEYAARGGLDGQLFPWGATIAHSQANYYSSTSYGYDVSPTRDYHPSWNDGIEPYTAPVGSFPANGYGLCDMAGNVWQWCNDWYSSSYYSSTPQDNPTGPASGNYRVMRGGAWSSSAYACRVSNRSSYNPTYRYGFLGFRICGRAVSPH